MTHFTKSLLIAGFLGCSVPTLLIGGGLISILLLGQIPVAESICQFIVTHIVSILQVFGTGNPVQGTIVISVAVGIVGVLFSTYNLLYLSRPIR